ncbi:hypothetical protein ZOSMA_12G00720 [Zostera marina]|uniref:Uncharacterized protein n=1 Tax=Zostera marina TaxID=29655 RepID=A0A0K9PZD9_ZOSMR|nr:hypothetical protein ZOSMA_12G00720 [Zostera marina]
MTAAKIFRTPAIKPMRDCSYFLDYIPAIRDSSYILDQVPVLDSGDQRFSTMITLRKENANSWSLL